MNSQRTGLDLCKGGHRQGCSVQTQLFNLCTLMCNGVYSHTNTHGVSVRAPSSQDPVAGALIYLHNYSHSPESQHLSAHVISQTPDLSLKKNKHSTFIPLLRVATCIHPSSALCAVAKEGFVLAGYAGLSTAQPGIYCVK